MSTSKTVILVSIRLARKYAVPVELAHLYEFLNSTDLRSYMAEDLLRWRRQSVYASDDHYVFASETMKGKQPYWPDNLMKRHIQPVAKAIGIHKKIGWHTFRHSFGTLLKANGEDVKTVQELLRDANSRITLDAYTGSEFEQAGCTEQGCKDDGVRRGS